MEKSILECDHDERRVIFIEESNEKCYGYLYQLWPTHKQQIEFFELLGCSPDDVLEALHAYDEDDDEYLFAFLDIVECDQESTEVENKAPYNGKFYTISYE